jgi:hypothetical protein
VRIAQLWEDIDSKELLKTSKMPKRSSTGEGVNWVVDPSGQIPLKIGREGVTSYRPQTIMEVFETTVAKHGR